MNWLDLTLIVLVALAAFTALALLAWECLTARPPMPRPQPRTHHVSRPDDFDAAFTGDRSWPSTARCSQAYPEKKSAGVASRRSNHPSDGGSNGCTER